MSAKQDVIRNLLADWISSQESVISEYSYSFLTSCRELIADAMERAELLDVEWDDTLVDEWVWDCASGHEAPRWYPN